MHAPRLLCAACLAFVMFASLGSGPLHAGEEEESPTTESEVAQEKRVLLPYVSMQPAPAGAVVVQGRLTQHGVPLVYTRFVLQECPADPNTPPLRVPGETDGAGNYYVIVQLRGASSIDLSLHYPADNTPATRDTLPSFKSVCVHSNGNRMLLPAIDLQGVELILPIKGSEIDMPILFRWQSRSHPAVNEKYQLIGAIRFNCASCAPVEVIASPLPYPSTSIQLECVHGAAGAAGDVVSGEFRLMLSSDAGIGYSEVQKIAVGATVRCS